MDAKKWGLSRGFVKLHALVNADTNAIKITDDSKADAPIFLELLDDALDGIGDGTDVSVLGDGAYGSRKNIVGCAERSVTPNLNITSGTKKTGRTWAEVVRQQLGGGSGSQVNKLSREQRKANREKWKKKIECGKRWIVEIIFSAFKRMFGDYISKSGTAWSERSKSR